MRTVSFIKEIYQPESIFSEAISAYSGIASIRFRSEKERYVVEFLTTRYDTERTVEEFCNYVLLLMQKRCTD